MRERSAILAAGLNVLNTMRINKQEGRANGGEKLRAKDMWYAD
jgi:hypothetical protein